MRILIAGGAGFVGANLALMLKQQHPDYTLVCIDNLSRQGSALQVPRLQQAGIQFIQADTRFPETLPQQLVFDAIIDAAAEPSVLAGLQGGLDYLVHTNFNGTVHLLQLAQQHGAAFLFLSTSRVYPIGLLSQLKYTTQGQRFVLDEDQVTPGVSRAGIREDFPLTGSRSFYGATKLASELLVEEFHAFSGLRTVINRFGVLAGPWQMGKVDQGVVALWVAHHIWQKPLQYIGFGGQGLQVRDMLHIADAYRLIHWQLHHIEQVNGQCFNVGGGLHSSASLAELTQLCREATGNEVPITKAAEDRPGDIPMYITDNSRITAVSGWQPQLTAADIVHDTCQWMLENRSLLQPIFGQVNK